MLTSLLANRGQQAIVPPEYGPGRPRFRCSVPPLRAATVTPHPLLPISNIISDRSGFVNYENDIIALLRHQNAPRVRPGRQ
jgi:hypothetical protein